MARRLIAQSRFSGLSYGEKEGLNSSFLWAKSMDYRTDPSKLKILPRTEKVSGSVVEDLIMCGDRQSTDAYFYGDTGNIYKRTSAEAWSNLVTAPESTGNGMSYFGEDLYLYYTSDKVIGRYGPFGGTKAFAHDFLGAEGGVPLNTASMDFESGSDMYATAADSASLSITSDMTLEGYFKWESLPAAAAQMVLMSKWDLNSDERSYKFDLAAVSAVFGDGGDGALTIAANTTQAPTDSACTGTAASYSLTATNAAFATGDKILIHQSRGTNAGQHERNEIASYTAGTITLSNALANTYTSGAQVIVMPEYTNVTVNSGKTWTAKAWNGTVGGILCFLANGTVTITGNIVATGKGFANYGTSNSTHGVQGEGTGGAGASSQLANGSGGGGGAKGKSPAEQIFEGGGGGGGGNATAGTAGEGTTGDSGTRGGAAGELSGAADLTTMTFGGEGGGGGPDKDGGVGGAGGNGGGIVFFYGATIAEITGTIVSNGVNGSNQVGTYAGGGGGGAGGSVLIRAQTATLGTTKITATAGSGGSGNAVNDGGAGSVGRIHLDYYTSYTGTTNPTLDYAQDDGLVTSTVYQLRFSVAKTDGTAGNSEVLAKEITTPALATWYRYAVTWDASTATAEFFIDGASIGTTTGAVTSCYDSTALFAIGASLDASSDDENHFDGKADDIRVFNDIRTDNELLLYKDVEISAGTPGLAAYWQLDSGVLDETANNNDLTLVNSPTYDTDDVPFSSPTTRRDLDQSLDTAGDVYTTTTAIDETATHRQTFVPAKDPQTSIEILVGDKGSGDWTVTVHDGLNREITSQTIVAANMVDGDNEFVFDSVWRPHIGASYHFHVTSTVADGEAVTTDNEDLETVDYHSYYQFLVEDDFHPVQRFLNFLAIGNERYLAKWDGTTYTPHKLTLPSGYRIRTLGTWREYLVMGCTLGTNIEDYDYGYLFFWDGTSTTYNYLVKIPEGGINAIQSGDPMIFMAGYSGDLMQYAGGKPKKLLRMPKVGTSVMEINPYAMAKWRALTHIGLAEDCSSTTLERGVFSWGSLDKELPETLGFDYPLSLGVTTGANIEIGMIFPHGSSMFVSWRNGGAYGVDSVTPTNNPYAAARIEFLITDADKIWAEKQSQVIRSYFKALSSGDSVQLEYKIDRASSWTEGTAVTTADKKEARLSLPTKGNRFNELQVALDLGTTNSTSPEVYGWAVDIDDMQRERRT